MEEGTSTSNNLSGNQLAASEFGEDLVSALADAVFGGFEAEFVCAGAFESAVQPGHAFHEAGCGFGVEAFDVAALAFGEGAIDADDEEALLGEDGSDEVAEVAGGGDEGDDDGEAGFHGEFGEVSGAADVFGAVFGGEAEV